MTLSDLTLNHASTTNSAVLAGFRMLDLDDIIARDDAAELADFLGHSVCKSGTSDEGHSVIVRFRNHTIEMSTLDTPALTIKIDGVPLDTSARPAITNLLLSLMSALQPPAALAS